MNKKIKFSEQPKKVKIIYASVIAVLCVTAIVVAVVSSMNNDIYYPDDEPTANLPTNPDGNKDQNEDEKPSGDKEDEKEEKPSKLTFTSPVVGEVTKVHSLDTPVFSDTLKEWRVHTGIDISTKDDCEVFASARGVVSRVYSDPFLGKTVEISHEGGIVSVYSNLSSSDIAVKEGDEVAAGDLIGKVGDTSISELADEAHLHFAIKVNGVSVNPLDYITEDSKKASLGITEV